MSTPCPDCHAQTVYRRFALKGLLYGIFCFPCGLYCCLRRRETHCSACHCEVITTQPTGLLSMGYNFRNYKAVEHGVPIGKSMGYRNAALSVVTATTTTTSDSSDQYDSQTNLVEP